MKRERSLPENLGLMYLMMPSVSADVKFVGRLLTASMKLKLLTFLSLAEGAGKILMRV